MLEQIRELENKLIGIRNSIKDTSIWIMRNKRNFILKGLLPEKKKKLSKLQTEYKDTQYKISDLKKKQREKEEKKRDLELLEKTQRKMEEIRRKKIEETKRLDAIKTKCKLILETNIPKFKELIKVTKDNIAILKDKRKNCLNEYKLDCPSNLESEQDIESKNAYNNAKLNLTTLHNEYNIEDCPSASCEILEKDFLKLDKMYQRKTKYLNYSQLQHEQCLKKNNERCEELLNQIKNTNNKTNVNMQLTSNISEGFSNNDDVNYTIDSIKLNNQNLKNMEDEIKNYKNLEYNNSKPNNDTQSLYYRELNKNILFTTLGSVLLYYLFFEM